MKVVFTGSSGSGKTTMVDGLLHKANHGELQFKLPAPLYSHTQDVYTKYKIYREEQVLHCSQTLLKQVQFELFETRLQMELDKSKYISDRSIIDYYIWTLIRCNGVLTYQEIEWMLVKLIEHVKMYDLVFFCEMNPLYIHNDPMKMRIYGQEYLYLALYRQLCFTLQATGTKFITLPWMNNDIRMDNVINNLEKLNESNL